MQPASSAAQPGLSELPPSIDSAEQPAVNPQDAEMDSIAGVATWLETFPQGAVSTSAPLKRVAEAVEILQAEGSRARRTKLQRMVHSWDVRQFSQSDGKQSMAKVTQNFETKVVQEAKRLKVLYKNNTSSAAPFSVIRLQLHS